MPERLIVAYLLIALLIGGLAGAIWWTIHNSERRRMKRYFRGKRNHTRR